MVMMTITMNGDDDDHDDDDDDDHDHDRFDATFERALESPFERNGTNADDAESPIERDAIGTPRAIDGIHLANAT